MASLRHILLLQRDVSLAARFYSEGLGLKLQVLTERWAELKAGQTTLALKAVEGEAFLSAGYTPILSFSVDDLHGTVMRLIQLGAILDGPIKFPPQGQDDDGSTWGGDLAKGGKAGQEGVWFGLELLSPQMAGLSQVSYSKKSATALSASKSPRSPALSHDRSSELTFDNWISTDICTDTCTDTWGGMSIGTADFDSIAAPVTTQDCLWRIFESDVNTEEIMNGEVGKPATPTAACKNAIMRIFRKKLNIQKTFRSFACFGGNLSKRKRASEIQDKIALCSRKPHHRVPAAGDSTKNAKDCRVDHLTGRFPDRRKGQGHSCGVKE